MITINLDRCIGCGACADDCVSHALELREGKAALAQPDWCLRCGHCIAICPREAVSDDALDMSRVRDIPADQRLVDPDTLLNLMLYRRSNRHFRPDAVPEEVIGRILEAGRCSPTAKNRQSTSFLVVQDAISALRSLALSRLGELGQAMLLMSRDPNDRRRGQNFIDWCKQYREQPDAFDPLFFHAPLLVLTAADKDGQLDAAAAAAYMELEAYASGLGVLYSGYFTAAAQGNEKISALLGLSKGQSLVRCLVLGYPDIRFRRTVPREPLQVRYL